MGVKINGQQVEVKEMNQAETLQALEKLFPSPQLQERVKVQWLLDKGATLKMTLFKLQIKLPIGIECETVLSAMSKYIMDGTLSAVQESKVRQECSLCIESAFVKLNAPGASQGSDPSKKLIHDALKGMPDDVPGGPKVGKPQVIDNPGPPPGQEESGYTLNKPEPKKGSFMKVPPPAKEAQAAQQEQAHMQQPETAEVKALDKIVNAIIALKDAKAVGQRVKGTSATSVYKAFAIGAVNLATRWDGNTLSIRAELTSTLPTLKSKLLAAQFKDKGGYFSLHLSLNGVDEMRVIGSVLYSLDMEFKAIATSKGVIKP